MSGLEALRPLGPRVTHRIASRMPGVSFTRSANFRPPVRTYSPLKNLLYLPRGAGVLQVSPGTRAHTHLAFFLRTWSLPHPALSTRHCIAYKRAPHFFLSLLSAAAPKTGNTEGDV